MTRSAQKEAGMTLIELMIATLIILVGVAGTMPLIAISMAGDGRSRQESNSAALAQEISEKIASVKASTNPTLTLLDCTGASFSVNTATGGSTLTTSGDVDYTQAAVTNYQMLYTNCATGGKQTVYDIRWNITQPTAYTKLLVVSAKKRGSATDPKAFSRAVTIRTLVGQGT